MKYSEFRRIKDLEKNTQSLNEGMPLAKEWESGYNQ